MHSTRPVRTPRTRGEWQDAVDWAEYLLCLDAARKYGLVVGGPAIRVTGCEQMLARGRQRGITPRPGYIERCSAAMQLGLPPTVQATRTEGAAAPIGPILSECSQ